MVDLAGPVDDRAERVTLLKMEKPEEITTIALPHRKRCNARVHLWYALNSYSSKINWSYTSCMLGRLKYGSVINNDASDVLIFIWQLFQLEHPWAMSRH